MIEESPTILNDVLNTAIDTISRFKVFPDRTWHIELYSAGCLELYGYSIEELMTDQMLWISRIFPEDLENVFSQVFEKIFAAETTTVEYRFRHKSNTIRWIRCNLTSRYDRSNQCWIVTTIDTDVSALKLTEDDLVRELNCSQIMEQGLMRIRQSLSLSEILDATVTEVREFLHTDRVVIYQSYPQGGGRTISESIGSGWTPMLGRYLNDSGLTDCTSEYLQGRFQATEDIHAAGLSDCYIQFMVEFQIRANLVIPIISEDQLLGLISAQHCSAPRLWRQDEIGLIEKLANAVALAMQQAHRHEQIQKSEERLLHLTENVPGMIYSYITHPDGSDAFTHVGDRCREILEVEPEMLLESSAILWNKIHLEDVPALRKSMADCIEAGLPIWSSEYRIITSSGSLKWLRGIARPKLQDNGDIIWDGFKEDISDRKHAEELLELQNRWLSCVAIDEPLSATLELLIGLIEYQLVGGICSVLLIDGQNRLNQIAAPNLPPEYSKTFNGIPVSEGVGSCGTAAFRRQLVITSDIATDPLWENFKHLALPHGLKSCWSMPIFARDREQVLGTFCIYYREVRQPSAQEIDIIKMAAISAGIAINRHLSKVTIQDQLQQEQFLYRHLQQELVDREQAEADLREGEEKYRFIVETAEEGIWKIDSNNNTTFVNQSMAEMLGYSIDEMIGMSIFEFMDTEAQELALRNIDLGRQGIKVKVDFKYRRRDGSDLWANLSANPTFNQQGEYLGAITVINDITAQHELDRIKDEFISVVSHELRTPLTAIRGALGILRTGIYDKQPEKAKHMLEIALNNTDRLSRLVNDILDLERLESEQAQLTMEICQVNDLMQQSIESVQEIASQSAVTLDYTPLSGEIWAGADAIMQALINLLSNSIKFSPEGSTVWLSAEVQDENIRFAIKDRGRGIPPDHLEKIFGRFQQVDISDARQKGGTGLGLSICKSIVQQHGGQIWAESILGEGSTFYFTLPVDRADR